MEMTELEGTQLDFWVAKAEGMNPTPGVTLHDRKFSWSAVVGLRERGPSDFRFSTDWAVGGPIIEREKIMVAWNDGHWIAGVTAHVESNGGVIHKGPTPLVAAMRAYVAAKLGTEIQNG
jgi:hypothetical protein